MKIFFPHPARPLLLPTINPNPPRPMAIMLSPPHFLRWPSPSTPPWDGLQPLRRWLNQIEIQYFAIANLICFLIPASCPFERDVRLLGRHLFSIPPLCHFNPVYDELMALRFRALLFLEEKR